jgi:hypothetical protein
MDRLVVPGVLDRSTVLNDALVKYRGLKRRRANASAR